jgi:hypothetical protein
VENKEYLKIIEEAGFKDAVVHVRKEIEFPDELLNEFLDNQQIIMVKNSDIGIYSITVSAYKS